MSATQDRIAVLERELGEMRERLAEAEAERTMLARRLGDSPRRLRLLEERVLDARSQLSAAHARNEKLAETLREARTQIASLREEVEKLTQLPATYGTLLGVNEDGTVDVHLGSRKLRVEVAPSLERGLLVSGSEVGLNEAQHVVLVRHPEGGGEVAAVEDLLADGRRAVVTGRGDEVRVVELADSVGGDTLRSGDLLILDTRGGVAIERVPRPEVEDLLLEEVPDVAYEDIGGLDEQIERIVDAVELPFLHPDLFAAYELPAPKGILLYGPPGCGKTLIAKAVAASLARKVTEGTGRDSRSYFINVKGPELLNKYVGETERHIRLVFQRARERAADGNPVIVFFDEMESLFRTRGSGISSDMEATIVPQLLAEIDGVETLRNVIVIGASNREDLIDPAILRPGRLDVKIKIERPDAEAATRIFGVYVTSALPVAADVVADDGGGDPEKAVRSIVESTVEEMFSTAEHNRFLEVTYQNGDREVMYFRDFASGAMIENIVRRAKKLAIKRELRGGPRGVRPEDFLAGVRQEFREHEDLPNTTNPDDWARISGKKGERIVYVRTLVSHEEEEASGGRSIEAVPTGQYL